MVALDSYMLRVSSVSLLLSVMVTNPLVVRNSVFLSLHANRNDRIGTFVPIFARFFA